MLHLDLDFWLLLPRLRRRLSAPASALSASAFPASWFLLVPLFFFRREEAFPNGFPDTVFCSHALLDTLALEQFADLDGRRATIFVCTETLSGRPTQVGKKTRSVGALDPSEMSRISARELYRSCRTGCRRARDKALLRALRGIRRRLGATKCRGHIGRPGCLG